MTTYSRCDNMPCIEANWNVPFCAVGYKHYKQRLRIILTSHFLWGKKSIFPASHTSAPARHALALSPKVNLSPSCERSVRSDLFDWNWRWLRRLRFNNIWRGVQLSEHGNGNDEIFIFGILDKVTTVYVLYFDRVFVLLLPENPHR